MKYDEIRIKILLLFIGMGIFIMSCGFNNVKVKNSSTPEQIMQRIQLPTIPDKDFNLLDFGAVADGEFDCKPAIDSAIVVISQNGGGRLIIPKGDFLINGPIHLESHINLHLEKGSKVFFSQNPNHYLPMQLVRWEGVEVYNYSPYIYAIHETDIAITGQGTFIGRGEGGISEWRSIQKPDQNRLRDMGKQLVPLKERLFGEGHYLRMSFIQLMHCTNIRISDITIEDVPFWVVHPTYCKSITINNIKINCTRINNDGVDMDSCEDALIEDCTFNAGDDAIAIKSGRDNDAWKINRPSKNIVIRNCLAKNVLHGMAFGSEMSGGVENIYVSNFIMKNVKEYAIQFKSNLDRGGYIRNVFMDGVYIDNAKTAIYFTNDYHSYNGGDSPSDFHNITIKNLICKNARGRSIDIVGLQDHPINHVELKNILILNEDEASQVVNAEQMIYDNITIGEKEIRLFGLN
ncbi:MAG: glycoside hydrolase family 28 protein [Bacteroidales bacterium]|nr:glycoside hydrolase family 28 protein [Bacteroidales bacterium]